MEQWALNILKLPSSERLPTERDPREREEPLDSVLNQLRLSPPRIVTKTPPPSVDNFSRPTTMRGSDSGSHSNDKPYGSQAIKERWAKMSQTMKTTLLVKPRPVGGQASESTPENMWKVIRENSWPGVGAMVAGIFQQTLCWGMVMAFGTILAYYEGHLMPGVKKFELCIVGAIQGCLILLMSLLWGRLLDAGYHRAINLFAGVMITGGLIGLAFTGGNGNYGDGKYYAIALASIPMGLGQSCYFLTAPHIAKSWYPRKKGLAMGFTNSGAAIGGTVWPLIFTRVTRRFGFRAGVGTLAGISGVLSLFITVMSVTKPDPETSQNIKQRITDHGLLKGAFKAHTTGGKDIGKVWSVRSWVPTKAFRSKTFRAHIVAMCLVYFGILTVPFLLEVWAEQKNIGLSEDTRSSTGVQDGSGHFRVWLVLIMNACQLPGRVVGSALCDKFKARLVHILACVIYVVLVLGLWLTASNYTQAGVFAGLFGAILGVMVSLPINDMEELLEGRPHLGLSQHAGLVYTCSSPFIFGGAVVAGLFVDRHSAAAAGIWTAGTIGVGASVIFFSCIITNDIEKLEGERQRDGDIEMQPQTGTIDKERHATSHPGTDADPPEDAGNSRRDYEDQRKTDEAPITQLRDKP